MSNLYIKVENGISRLARLLLPPQVVEVVPVVKVVVLLPIVAI